MAAAAPINVPPYQELEYDDLCKLHNGSGEILLIPIDINHPDAPFITVMFKPTKNASSIIKSSVGKKYTPYVSLVRELVDKKYKDYGGEYYASVLEKKDNIRSYKYSRQKNGEIVYTILVCMPIFIEAGNIVPHGAFGVNSTKIRELLLKSMSFVKLDDETIRRHIYFGKNNSMNEPGARSAQIKSRNKSRKNSRKNLRNKSGKNSAAKP